MNIGQHRVDKKYCFPLNFALRPILECIKAWDPQPFRGHLHSMHLQSISDSLLPLHSPLPFDCIETITRSRKTANKFCEHSFNAALELTAFRSTRKILYGPGPSNKKKVRPPFRRVLSYRYPSVTGSVCLVTRPDRETDVEGTLAPRQCSNAKCTARRSEASSMATLNPRANSEPWTAAKVKQCRSLAHAASVADVYDTNCR